MSPVSTNIGKIFQQRHREKYMPPKALYADLESAYESITRKTSSSHSYTGSLQDAPPDNPSRSSRSLPEPLPHLLPVYYRSVAERPLFSNSLLSARVAQNGPSRQCQSPEPLRNVSPGESLRTHTTPVCKTKERQGTMKTVASDDASSQWQTVENDSTIAADPRIKRPRSDMAISSPNMQLVVPTRDLQNAQGPLLEPNSSLSLDSLNQFAWSPFSSEIDDTEASHRRISGSQLSDHGHYHLRSSSCSEKQKVSPSFNQSSENPQHFDPLMSDLNLAAYKIHHASRRAFTSSSVTDPLEGNGADCTHCFLLSTHSHITGVVSDGSSCRPMSHAELEDSLSILMHSAVNASTMSTESRHPLSLSCVSIQPESIDDSLPVSQVESTRGVDSSNNMTSAGSLSPQLSVPLSSQNNPIKIRLPADTSLASVGHPLPKRCLLEHREMDRPLLDGRLAQAAAAVGIEENGRLGRALIPPLNSSESIKAADRCAASSRSSSLKPHACGSDEIEEAASSEIRTGPCSRSGESSEDCKPFQLHSHPRYNNSWSLVRNAKTGSLTLIPALANPRHIELPSIAFQTTGRDPPTAICRAFYRHPKPLPHHVHPMARSPRITPSKIDHARLPFELPLTTAQQRMRTQLSNSEYSFDSSDDSSDQNLPKAAVAFEDPGRPANVDLKSEACQLPKRNRLESSAWLSTVSEAESMQHSCTARISSFAKQNLIGHKGNLTGTPEGTGAREVGSSLAGGSSPGENSEGSPTASSATSPSRRHSATLGLSFANLNACNPLQAFHRELEGPNNAQCSRDCCKSRAGRKEFPSSTADQEMELDREQDAPGGNLQRFKGTKSAFFQYRTTVFGRRSAAGKLLRNVSNNTTSSSQIVWRDYLPALGRRGSQDSSWDHKGRKRAIALADRQREDIWQAHRHESNDGRSAQMAGFPEVSLGECVATMRQGQCSANAAAPDRPIAVQFPSSIPQMGIPLSMTPRLYEICERLDGRLKTQQLLYSRTWALICVILPFLGPIFGHGYMDRIMTWHSKGTVTEFRKEEKTAILFYSYAVFGLVLISLVVTIVILAVN